MDGWELLAADVVITAIKDYRKALSKIKANTDDVLAEEEAERLEKFFLSD